MAALKRTAEAIWRGDLKSGKGQISATSGVLKDTPYSFATRFFELPWHKSRRTDCRCPCCLLQHGICVHAE